MIQKLVYIHTVASLVGPFNDLSKELLLGVEVFHIADEMLLKVVLAQGGLSPFIFQRVAEHVVAAERLGAAAVQCTCSSISPCVDASRPFVGIPVLKIDEPMVDLALHQALRSGHSAAHNGKPRIGVAATVPTTLKPTTDLVQARAAALGMDVQVESALCEGAFALLQSGDAAAHDQMVSSTLRGLMQRSDVVILAQASMARVAALIPAEEQTAPILSSPRLAVQHLAEVLSAL